MTPYPSWVAPKQMQILECFVEFAAFHAKAKAEGKDDYSGPNVPLRQLCRLIGLNDRNSCGVASDIAIKRLKEREGVSP